MKKFLSVLLISALLLTALPGCGCKHEWVAATCDRGEYCSLCQKEGKQEALGHSLSPANYQQGPVCTVCGAEEGAPLEPEFVTHGLTAVQSVDEAWETDCTITTQCYDDPKLLTTGEVYLNDYTILDFETQKDLISSIKKESGLEMLPAEAGYEWRYVHLDIYFNDENAYHYDVSGVGIVLTDYYTITAQTDGNRVTDDGIAMYPVSRNGETYECCAIAYLDDFANSQNGIHIGGKFAFHVPVGYDGTVIGLLNTGVQQKEGQYIYELDNTDSLYLRIN